MAVRVRKFADVVGGRIAAVSGAERELGLFLERYRGGSFPWLAANEPHEPAFYRGFVYFNGRFFKPEREPLNPAEREEIVLRVKKAIYEEDAELSSLRATVSNLEAAVEYQRTGLRRSPISEDVKMLVWARDGGACVRCGSQTDLHFDHIIPVAKGGGNTEANIQILCQTCNLKKSDKIAVP